MRHARPWVPALAIAGLVLLIYGQTWHHDFIRRYDDGTYILDNPMVRDGFSRAGLAWAFGVHAANWHPLTWFSHMLDGALFGTWAGGHHLHAALLHALAAALALAVLARATGQLWRSALVAALFALHPLRVESVAWAAERKDVLSGLCWFLALAAYLGYVRRPAVGRYLAVAGAFALGLAAKPMVVTFPFVLLVLDWWPLGRLQAGGGAGTARRAPAGRAAALIAEKAPLIALSALAAALAYRSHTAGIYDLVQTDPAGRLANAVVSYAFYLGKFLWPVDLGVLYPFPAAGVAPAEVAAAVAVLVALGAVGVLLRRTRPWLLAGSLWYLITLLPVIGLVQSGAQARADRYTYLPFVGAALAAVWLGAGLRPPTPGLRRLRGALIAAVLAACTAAAFFQTRLWRDGVTLFAHTARVTDGNYLMLSNLGAALIDEQRYAEAARALEEAIRVNPGHCDAIFNLGSALFSLERFEAALPPYRLALECYRRNLPVPRYIADAHYTVGAVLERLGRRAEAREHLREALRLRPHLPEARRLLERLDIGTEGAEP